MADEERIYKLKREAEKPLPMSSQEVWKAFSRDRSSLASHNQPDTSGDHFLEIEYWLD